MTTRYASSAYDPTSFPFPQLNAQNSQGHVREMQSNVNLPIGHAPGDLVIFGHIPSNVKVGRNSDLYFGALTTVTSFDVGLFVEAAAMTPDLDNGAAACLISALDVHLAGKANFDAIAPANGGKYAWELAGLSKDPGGFLLVVGQTHAAGGTATAAADVDIHVKFRVS